MSYEHEAGTVLLAQACIFCSRPLRDPESIERGCGPYCARKHQIFTMTGSPNPEATERALATMPGPMAAVIRPKLSDPRTAVSAAIHAAGHAVEINSADAMSYVGAAMEIASALGYPGTSEALTAVFIEGRRFNEEGQEERRGKPKGVVISDAGARGWQISLPYISSKDVWRSIVAGLKSAGATQDRSTWAIYFPPERWVHVINALVDNLSGALGILPSGETFVVPKEKQPVPADATAPEGPTDTVALDEQSERQAGPPIGVEKGAAVTLLDGRPMVVSWVADDKSRVGLVTPERAAWSLKKYGYIWTRKCDPIYVGGQEIATVTATAAEKQEAAEVARAPEQKVTRERPPREIPEKFFPFQREGVSWLDQVGSGILAFEQGLGKTCTSIVAADAPVLVVCPASLRVNWAREVGMWRPDLTVAVAGVRVEHEGVLAGKQTKLTRAQLQADVVVVSYEGMKANLEELLARGFRTMIVDEAQYCKELLLRWKKSPQGDWEQKRAGSARAQNADVLAQQIDRKFLLTGTPMVNGRPYELWPLLHMVDAVEWKDQKKFWQTYCDLHKRRIGGRQFDDYTGATEIPALRERIHGRYLLRKTKDELDLPEKWRQSKLLSLSAEWAEHYRDAAEEFFEWLTRTRGREAAERASRNEILVQLTNLRRLAAMGKVQGIIEEVIAHHESTGRPLIVMAHHKEVVHAIRDAAVSAGMKVGTITGDDSPEKKEHDKTMFQEGLPLDAPVDEREYLDLLVCSVTAAGVGLTLTRATEMIMVERVWRPYDLIQAEDRIHRIGQQNRVTITYYDAPGTIDQKLAAVMADKMAVAEAVLGQGDEAACAALDIASSVIDGILGELEDFRRNGPDAPVPEWADPE